MESGEVVSIDEMRLKVYLRNLEANLVEAQMVFYQVDSDLLELTQPIWRFQVPEKLYKTSYTPEGEEGLADELDRTIGKGEWAVTPTTDKGGKVIIGLVDIVTIVKERHLRIAESLSRAALPETDENPHPTDD